MNGRVKPHDSHLKVSACRIWQLAWCSNWSSSHKKFRQKEQRKIRPPAKEMEHPVDFQCSSRWDWFTSRRSISPWSQTPRSHSMQSASARGHEQAWVLRHFLPWQTQASQKSHTAPLWIKTGFTYLDRIKKLNHG